MTQTDISAAVTELGNLVMQHKGQEAFDKFYADDVDMIEWDGSHTVGKAANRQRRAEFAGKITALREQTFVGFVATDSRAFVVWKADMDHTDFGPIQFTEVAIQDWRDGQIVREQFVK